MSFVIMTAKKVGIFGYGVTTKPLVTLLNDMGISCLVFEDRDQEENEGKNHFVPSRRLSDYICDLDFAITSPGIPPFHTMIQICQKNNLRLLSEYDFFALLFQEKNETLPIEVWISGTNGKTTTTEMIEFLLKDHFAISGGNIGTPLAVLYKKAQQNQETLLWILETSSFCLHYTQVAFPKLYILLPLFEDHISWHGDFQSYVNDKLSPLARMKQDGFAILPSNLKGHPLIQKSKAKIYFYKDSFDLDEKFNLGLSKSIFQEPFLLDSALALSAQKILFEKSSIKDLNNFKVGSHRIQEFYDLKGRLWVDDSKGTNVDATCAAIKRYKNKKSIYLILGGDDKGANQKPIFELLKILKNHIELYLIGSNANKLLELALEFNIDAKLCGNLDIAVKMIDQKLKTEEVALLSPAAASLDQFKSYKERGDKFQEFVLKNNMEKK